MLDWFWKRKFQSESLRTLKGIPSTFGNIKSRGGLGEKFQRALKRP
jgi:hypothetical protein